MSALEDHSDALATAHGHHSDAMDVVDGPESNISHTPENGNDETGTTPPGHMSVLRDYSNALATNPAVRTLRPRKTKTTTTTQIPAKSQPKKSTPNKRSLAYAGFIPRQNDEAELWEVEEITDEDRLRFKVQWAGLDPVTGLQWEQSWVKKNDCTNDLVMTWRAKQAQGVFS
jgi:hypothetical protein